MTSQSNGLYKLGGLSFVISGVLFLAVTLLGIMAGPVPSSGAEIIAWATAGKLYLAFVSEGLFFALVLMIPAVVALYRSPLAAPEPRTREP